MIFGMRYGDPFGEVRASALFATVNPAQESGRILSWTPVRTTGVLYHVIMDGIKKYIAEEGIFQQILSHVDQNPRSVIEVIETSILNRTEALLNVVLEPDDTVSLTWSPVTGATDYKLFRKISGGSFGDPIFETSEGFASFAFLDGPLTDANYVYRLEALDGAENLTFDEENVTISSAPARPSNLAGSWNPGTSVFTLTWSASASADLDHYNIRQNGGSGPTRLDDTPADTVVPTTFSKDLTGLTGDFEFLVRAEDGDAKEDQNVSQMLRIGVIAGVHEGLPSVPLHIQVKPLPGGKARLTFVYFPLDEEGFNPVGVADEARIYFDNGTGIVDFVTPLGVVAMGNPIVATTFTFDSGVLADDTYLFAVRIATGTAGAGNETTNTDTHEVTTDAILPAAVDLTATII